MMSLDMFPFNDKNGSPIDINDVLFDGEIYWRPGDNAPEPDIYYLISCEKGYLHELTQEVLSQYENIGAYDDEKAKLFECD